MKHLLGTFKLLIIVSIVFAGKAVFAVPVVDANLVHYTLQPKSGATFNRVERLSIVMFADKLSKEFKAPYSLNYTISDKEGRVVEGAQENIMFTMCNDKMVPVKTVGQCGEYNNVATISLKNRQTRRPPSTNGYRQEGRFWINEAQAGKFPRFEEMEYKIDSFQLLDRDGKIVNK